MQVAAIYSETEDSQLHLVKLHRLQVRAAQRRRELSPKRRFRIITAHSLQNAAVQESLTESVFVPKPSQRARVRCVCEGACA